MQPTDRTPQDFRELILSQFEPDIAVQLLEFGKLISRLDADYIIFMARKSLCLYDVLIRIGVTPTERLVLSDRVLDMNADRFVGKRIALIDDTLILGTTLAKTKLALLTAGAAEVTVHVFCIDEKWWCKELLEPDSCMVHLPDDRVMTFCAAAVRAMSLIPRPYLVDFPLSKPLKIRADEEQCFLSNLDWRGFNISTSLQERYDVSSMSFFPIGATRDALGESWGAHISGLLDIVKVRGFARKLRDVYWLQIVPIVVLKPIHRDVLDDVLKDILDRIPSKEGQDFQYLLELANTPRSRQRLVQYILSCIVGHEFVSGSELALSNELSLKYDPNETDRHYGPWLGQYLSKIGEVSSLAPTANRVDWKPATIPQEVLQWAGESLTTDAVQKQEESDDYNGRLSTNEVRNLIPSFSDIFVRHYDAREVPAREAVHKSKKPAINDVVAGNRDRLEMGLPWGTIIEHLRQVAHLESLTGSEDALSLVLDFCNDQGIAVPVTSITNDIVFRAYRHGEDVKFTDAEVALAYQSIAGYLGTTKLDTIPRLRLEKLLVILMKIGIARGFMEPLFLTANGVQEVLRIGFYLHGAVPMLQRGPKDRADRDMWFTDHLRHKSVIIRKVENGQYALGKAPDGNFRVTTAPDDAYELGAIIGMLSKTPNGDSGPLNGRALTLLASCGSPRHTAAAVQVELDIFRRWYEDIGRNLMICVDWDSIPSLKESLTRILTSKGFFAVHEARLKFVGYKTDETTRIIDECSKFLNTSGNDLARRKWNSYWQATKILEAPGEKEIFDKELTAAIRLCWDVAACLSAIEISFVARISELETATDHQTTVDACHKLKHYGEGLIALGLQATVTSSLIDRFDVIATNPAAPWDKITAAKYAQSLIERQLPQIARQVEIMNPLIEEFGRLLGRRDYAYMVYYDIIDSTATMAAAKGDDVQRYRARVRTLKNVLSRGFEKLSQSAQRRASEVFCWNGAETSTNDCKHVFIGGTDSMSFLQETVDLILTSLRAAPGQRVRIYVVPCGFAGATAYRTQWETEVSGERFWEHWSRLAKAAKPLEESVGETESFLLVATADLSAKLTLPDSAEWIGTSETLLRSEIEGLIRETPTKHGAIRPRS